MKKIVAVGALAAMAAGIAFADGITFGSWGRGIWNTAASAYSKSTGDNDVITDSTQSWGGAGPRTALSIHGTTAQVGFDLDVFGNGTSLGIGDNALIWTKPIEQIKLTLGKIDKNELRGDGCFGLWNWDRIGSVGKQDQEGLTFPDLLDNQGASVSVYPVKGLTVGYSIPLSLDGTDASGTVTDGDESDDIDYTLAQTYANHGKYAAAYAIPDIGTIKIGAQAQPKYYNKDGEKKDVTLVNAAFDLTAVKNFYFSVGAEIPTASVYKTSGDLSTKIPTKVNAYARYTLDKMVIHGLVGTKIDCADTRKDKDDPADTKEDGQLGYQIGLGIDYAFEKTVSVFADVRYANGIYMDGASYKKGIDGAYNKADCITAGAGIVKGFSNGSIGIGVECATNDYGRYSMKSSDDMAWEIPIRFEYSF